MLPPAAENIQKELIFYGIGNYKEFSILYFYVFGRDS